ncbi:MAG TPA: chemotaxis protein CheW [Candidatus Kapabacteria bacterium]|nr:chemotaxis protein CheW [Candidatus Kapabacteria bacterium]HPO63114.1 chemotaxis protein CheW [Candidatus Kapabacteria bacterium]
MEKTENTTKCWKEIGVWGLSTCAKLDKYIHCRHCPEYSKAGRQLLNRAIEKEAITEATIQFSLEKEETQGVTLSVVIFRIENEWLAIRTEYFQEIQEWRQSHSIPFRTNRCFKGIVNINGELLLCISASELIGVENKGINIVDLTKKRLIILKNENLRYVIEADEFIGVVSISQDELQKTPSTISKSPKSLSVRLFNFKSLQIGLLDQEKLFNTIEEELVW